MAEENKETKVAEEVATQDRGLFDFMGKKEEAKPKDEAIAAEFGEKVQVSEAEPKVEEPKKEEEGEKKPGLLEKLHRSSSSSSSSSDEEEGEGGEKKKKKKEKKGKQHEDTSVPVEVVHTETPHDDQPEEKKGFLDKIKEKLPGQHKKAEEVPPPPPPPPADQCASTEASHEGEAKEKKGFLDKIKEKLPGYHSKTDEEKEVKDKSVSV